MSIIDVASLFQRNTKCLRQDNGIEVLRILHHFAVLQAERGDVVVLLLPAGFYLTAAVSLRW